LSAYLGKLAIFTGILYYPGPGDPFLLLLLLDPVPKENLGPYLSSLRLLYSPGPGVLITELDRV